MSPHKLRKIRKLRGSRTMAWGQTGQHRKHSQKGQRKVGRHKHLWTYVLRYEPDYFGKRGFKTPQSLKGLNKPNTINIGQLNQLIDKLTKEKQLTKKKGKTIIDLGAHGYQKLLATGKITKPITVKVNSYSQNAAKKIKDAGGHILGAEPREKEKPTKETDTHENLEEPPKD